jgi:hypothetical protein
MLSPITVNTAQPEIRELIKEWMTLSTESDDFPAGAYTTEHLGICGLIARISVWTWNRYRMRSDRLFFVEEWFAVPSRLGTTLLFWEHGGRYFGRRLSSVQSQVFHSSSDRKGGFATISR